MNETDYIVQKLVEMGWEDSGDGDLLSPDSKFKANVRYMSGTNLYIVRIALMGIFDRWANSGITRVFRNKGMVLEFFKKKTYMTAAYEEALMLLEDNLADNPSAVGLMDKIIDMTIDWFSWDSCWED